MENIRVELSNIVELIDAKDYKTVDKALAEYLKDISDYIVFLGTNNIIAIEELNVLSKNMSSAIENKDYFLLKDVIKYALISVYDQIFVTEEPSEDN